MSDMSKRYRDILARFNSERQNLNQGPDFYVMLEAACQSFFDDIEALSYKKIFEYIKRYDFNQLVGHNPTKKKFELNDKNFKFLSCLMILAINKYGIDVFVKDLLPDCVEPNEKGIFYDLIRFFISLFRKEKIKIKEEASSASEELSEEQNPPLNKKLSNAVDELRKWKGRMNPFYSVRGQVFFNELAVVCEKIFKEYVKPIDNFVGCRQDLVTAHFKAIKPQIRDLIPAESFETRSEDSLSYVDSSEFDEDEYVPLFDESEDQRPEAGSDETYSEADSGHHSASNTEMPDIQIGAAKAGSLIRRYSFHALTEQPRSGEGENDLSSSGQRFRRNSIT